MSLVEATIILMVIALLTAVIAPSARGYISDAQESAAKKDTEAIASALTRMLHDVGEAWFLRDGNGTLATNPPLRDSTKRVDMLVSNGTIPTLTATARGAGTDWNTAVDNAAVNTLDNYLILNTVGYRTASDMSVTAEFDPNDGAGFNSEYAWRGAYLTGPIGPDPWANRYAANVEFLARTQGTSGSGSRMDVIVISAGVNTRTDTRFEVDGQTPGGDDIIAVVSGGTR